MSGRPRNGGDRVRDQYDAFPYPARDPRDESRRLIAGSPSDPREIDHFLFAGRRDWSRPFRALVAGGGSGDGLVQLAQMLAWAGVEAEITYLDLSRSARRVAEARARARGLAGIAFHTGSLLDAGDLGRFDYIDCCGVLHHLDDPGAGFATLRGALAPGGGLGFMVYAPHGRSGVYPLQSAYDRLFGHLPPKQKLAAARKVHDRVPEGHPFRRNSHLVDHLSGDAGFFDLLLHSRDRAMAVPELLATLAGADLRLVSFVQPALYDLSRFATRPKGMDAAEAMALAEDLGGTLKVHVGYAVAAEDTRRAATASDMTLVPRIKGAPPEKIAAVVARGDPLPLRAAGQSQALALPRDAAPLIAAADGRRSLSEIAATAGVSDATFRQAWTPVEAGLGGWGVLVYSALPGPPDPGARGGSAPAAPAARLPRHI